jgi:hypothetical protein
VPLVDISDNKISMLTELLQRAVRARADHAQQRPDPVDELRRRADRLGIVVVGDAVTERDAAEVLGIDRERLRGARRQGKIAPLPGPRPRYTLDELARYATTRGLLGG